MGADRDGDRMPEDGASDLARSAAALMWQGDRASQALGMTIVEIAPGRAVLAMTIRDDMVNGHGSAHGGMIFALADSAFAFACNSRGAYAVAANCTIAYLAPGRVGDRLTATATETAVSGRTGIYDVTVAAHDRVIATFRGQSRSVPGRWTVA